MFSWLKGQKSSPKNGTQSVILSLPDDDTIGQQEVSNEYINEMNDNDFLILFGTESGTAEEFAFKMAEQIKVRCGQRSLVYDPAKCIFEGEFLKLASANKQKTIIFITNTWDEGFPAANATGMCDWLTKKVKEEEKNLLKGIDYTVFGLGDSKYDQFNVVAKAIDEQMETLGAQQVCPLGLGDESGDLRQDFDKWMELFFNKISRPI